MANEPNEEEQPLLHAATYTQAPKVSHKVLTKEERQTLIKEHEAQQQEAAKLDEAASKGRIGRWWSRLQSGPDKITPAMAIVALGVVYGDIGTSPLYTMQTFLNGQGGLAHTDRAAVLGILSLVFWSITLITTVKYVFIAMRIDNNGEGGIFALYSLIRKYGAWLAIPAMLGGAAFLADSVLTPAVSISSAVEGLETLPLLEPIMSENKELTLMITIVIIVCLFAVQSRGTERIGRTFGTVVMIWFSFLAVVGLVNLSSDWSVLEALNPVYGVEFLFSHHNAAGLAVMGTVFRLMGDTIAPHPGTRLLRAEEYSCPPPAPKRCIPTWATSAAATSTSRGRSSRSPLCSAISARARGCSTIGTTPRTTTCTASIRSSK